MRAYVALVLAPMLIGAAPVPAPVPAEIPVVLLIDAANQQPLFAREPERRFMPASVTKVMTAYTAFRLIEEGRFTPATRTQISQALEDEWWNEGSTMFLKAGEQPTVGELILGVTTVSGNDASVALALAGTGSVASWVALMNRHAAELGMAQTHFGGVNGFPDEGQTFTTANDLATLGTALVTRFPGLYRRYFGHRQLTWRNITQPNHDPVTGVVPGADGMKTGFTSEAGYTFMGSGERDGRRLVMVLAGAPSAGMRDDAARALLEWGFSQFARAPLTSQGTQVTEALVQDGASSTVSLRTAMPLSISQPVGASAAPRLTVRYTGPLPAPISAGDRVATMLVEVAGMPPYEVPLVAGEDVPRAGFLRRLWNGLTGAFA